MASVPTLISNVRDFPATVVNGDGTNKKTVVTPAAAGTRLKALYVTSDDTSDRTLILGKTISAVDYLMGEVLIPDGSGTNGTDPAVNLLSAVAMPGLQYDGVSRWIDIATGTTFWVKAKVAVTSGKTLYVLGEGGDFT